MLKRDLERFWSKVDKNGPTMPGMPTPCWLWTSTLSRGYGVIRIKDKNYFAHRISLGLKLGRRVKNCGLHKCNNPPCINPDHLSEGSRAENNAYAIKCGRNARGDMLPVHRDPSRTFGSNNNAAKLTENIVLRMRSEYRPGIRGEFNRLAKKYKVCHQNARDIILRNTWKHI